MEEITRVNFTAKLRPLKPYNDEMTWCRCYVMALGKNDNKSNISLDAANDALSSLYNIPVVGHIYADENGQLRMGGHDIALVKSEDGGLKLQSLTVPYGVVPYQDNVHYEDVVEEDGTMRTYLVADVILWTARYPELLDVTYDKDVYFAQSMEIKVHESSRMDDGYTDIKKYHYSGLCLLNKSDDYTKNVQPCFPSARVEPYQYSSTEVWDKLFAEFKQKLTDGDNYPAVFEKGEDKKMDKDTILQILKEYSLNSIEDLDFEITAEMTEEDLRAALQEKYAAVSSESGEGQGGGSEDAPSTASGEAASDTGTDFAAELTYNEKWQKLSNCIMTLCVHGKDYYLNDFDDQYVYVSYFYYDEMNNVKDGHARMPYFVANGEVSVDFEKIEEVRRVWLTEEEASKFDAEHEEYAALVDFKNKKLEEERKRAFSAVIDEFSDLTDIEEYSSVVGNAMSFASEDALREKLYAIRGKYGKLGKQKPLSDVHIPINFEKNQEDLTDEDKFYDKYLPGARKKN